MIPGWGPPHSGVSISRTVMSLQDFTRRIYDYSFSIKKNRERSSNDIRVSLHDSVGEPLQLRSNHGLQGQSLRPHGENRQLTDDHLRLLGELTQLHGEPLLFRGELRDSRLNSKVNNCSNSFSKQIL